MNAYLAMRKRHQQEVNALPIKFAFGDAQFKKMMEEFGLQPDDTDKICSLFGTAGCCLKTDADLIRETFDRHEKELDEAITADKDGTGFLYDMFLYELDNHEYGYTYDPEPTLSACGMTIDEVIKNPILLKAFENAKQTSLNRC